MHLGVTFPQAVPHPPSCLCGPQSFLSMQLESEIPRQLVSTSPCAFPFFVRRAPISARITSFLQNQSIFDFAFPNFSHICVHYFSFFFTLKKMSFIHSQRDNQGYSFYDCLDEAFCHHGSVCSCFVWLSGPPL